MIQKDEVKKIARLARLELKVKEVEIYQREMDSILEYFEQLKKASGENIEPMTHAVLLENVWREDVFAKESPSVISAMMKLAPAVHEGFLKVKSVFLQK